MSKYGLFLGCVIPNRYPGIESATREVLNALDIDYVDLEGASCCPAPGVTKSFDHKTWLSVGARNLSLAENKGLDLLTICNGCYASLFEATHDLNRDEGMKAEVNEVLNDAGMQYQGNVKVKHFVEVFHREVGLDRISSKVVNSLDGLKVAVHYGCHLLKPGKIKKIDTVERPTILDELVECTGALSIDYKDKNLCCGAGGGVRAREPDLSLKMTKEKLDNIIAVGGEMILDCCPFCHLQYDRGQKDIGNGYNLPVIHLNQLYGLACGLDRKKLGFDLHEIPVTI